jgi:NitT/TauT family transport system permease protein
VELFQLGKMQEHVVVTLQRVALAFLIGAVPGVLLGLLMGWVNLARLIFDPIISFIYPIPRIAILPLFLVIFGLGTPPIVAIAALICFFPAAVTTYAGVKGLDPNLPLMALNMGASRVQLMRKIAFPAALPVMFAGLRLALGVALTGEVAAEFVAANTGLGAQIWLYWQIFRIDEMYSNIVVVAGIGIILSFGLLEIQRRALAWAEDIDILR